MGAALKNWWTVAIWTMGLLAVFAHLNPARAQAVEAGTFQDGFLVGNRNGELIAERIYDRTIERNGCAALGSYQNALNAVVSRVRSPGRRGSQFAAGFFQGYLSAIRKNVKETRAICSVARFEDGSFVGALYANLYCQIAADDDQAVELVEFSPIYEEWNADDAVAVNCGEVFATVTADCGLTGLAEQLLGRTQNLVCAAAPATAI